MAEVNFGAFHCLAGSQHIQGIGGGWTNFEGLAVVIVEFHDSIEGPLQLPEEVLAGGLVPQQEIRVVEAESVLLLNAIRPRLQSRPAKPAFALPVITNGITHVGDSIALPKLAGDRE